MTARPIATLSSGCGCMDNLETERSFDSQATSVIDVECCDNCNETETITHLLYECHKATEIWQAIIRWLERISPNTMYFDKTSVLLGNTRNDVIINYIILTTKHEIYKSKWNKTKLTLTKLKHIFKIQMELEIYIGTVKNSLPKVLGK